MPEWSSDAELCNIIRRELYTPVVGDILDAHGRFHQFLPPEVRPIEPGMTLAGRAMPVLQVGVSGPQTEPFGRMTEALDDLRADEIYVATGGSASCANWGEIMTAAAKAQGAVGAVVDGFHRDTPRVLEQGFPVFSRGAYAQDAGARMKVLDFRCRIEITGVVIEPGDLVVGDCDGVLVLPADLVEGIVAEALDKARAEKKVRFEIENGMSCTEAFNKYGVL